MPELAKIPLVDLLIDTQNPRLRDEQPNQPTALLTIAKQEGKGLIKLAADIIEHGTDPTALPAVIPNDPKHKTYMVVEGNRRVTALKALETPSLVAPSLSQSLNRHLNELSEKFHQNPISEVQCVLFEPDDSTLNHWVALRHTGKNEGAGLSEWGSDEKDRWAARSGPRSPAGQIIDFIEKHGQLSKEAKQSDIGIHTNLNRLIRTAEVREKLGVNIANGIVYTHFPPKEVAKSLTYIIEEFLTKKKKVGNIYTKEQRIDYIDSLPKKLLPKSSSILKDPVLLSGDTLPKDLKVSSTPPKKPKRKPRERERKSVIPHDCYLAIRSKRIDAICNDLQTINVNDHPNACSVTLRVFVELSTDDYIEKHKLIPDPDKRSNTSLARKLKLVSDQLLKLGQIEPELKDAVHSIADNKHTISASTQNFNQYVHNKFVYPKSHELITAWDELQPFMEKLWP